MKKAQEQAPEERSRVGRYRLLAPIARGGMGTVYRVEDTETGQTLALKRMREGADGDLVALFEREYRTLAALEHPRIIRVFDYGVDAGVPYYSMELLEGRDLYDLAPVSFKEACRYLRDVATCLSLLHARQLLHRDVTPRNVRVTPDGRCKLLDFGALTPFGIPHRAVGTPPFVPPEALHETPLDQRADIFSLGALAYWLVTRQHAFPARQLSELPGLWAKGLVRPSKFNPDIPAQADLLIGRMLSPDPRVRPGSIAEVVGHLEVLGELPPEDARTQRSLAQSYFQHTQFVGRSRELAALSQDIRALRDGATGCIRALVGAEGLGRTRMLREAVQQADLLGVRTVFVDGADRSPAATALKSLQMRSLVVGESLRAHGRTSMAPIVERDAAQPGLLVNGGYVDVRRVFHEAFELACRESPLLLVIDNLEQCDETSRALFASLPRACEGLSLAIFASVDAESSLPTTYARSADPLVLEPLTREEYADLARSIFGDAPHLQRFSEWVYTRCDGRPLHSMEMLHQLFVSGQVRYEDGLWLLPASQPEIELPASLAELLAVRLAGLSQAGRRVAEGLALQRRRVPRDRALAIARDETDNAYEVLDELVAARVIAEGSEGYRFAHSALAERLRNEMDPERKRALHRRCAVLDLEHAAAGAGPQARVEAGWHLLEAGDEERGADLLAELAFDTVGLRLMFADAQSLASTLEVALKIYERGGRSLRDRMPLLAALAQAGYYEDLSWADRYGDEALEAVEELAGISLARKLRPLLGRTLSLMAGMGWAALRLRFGGPKERRYGMHDVLVSLFAVVTTLTGCAAASLDAVRAVKMAERLEPFSHLPPRLTPVGIGQFCESLAELCRDTPSRAVSTWTRLLERFNDPRYYPTLPEDARALYVGGLWFARGALAAFKDSKEALQAADELDRLGLRLYQMIASQIRVLYYSNRGAMVEAERHRRELEMFAIQIGSASQVEVWSPAALLVCYGIFGDMVSARHLADRIALLADKRPHMRFYAHLAISDYEVARSVQMAAAQGRLQHIRDGADQLIELIQSRPPRDFIGWGASLGIGAMLLNRAGLHEEAMRNTEYALAHIAEEDFDYVTLYLGCQLEHAIAIAALGDVPQGNRLLDGLLARHRASDNPITRGRIHEACARVAAIAEDWPSHTHHTTQARKWFQQTEVPTLMAQVDALEALRPRASDQPVPQSAEEDTAVTVHRAPRRTRTTARTRAEADSRLREGSEGTGPVDATAPEIVGS